MSSALSRFAGDAEQRQLFVVEKVIREEERLLASERELSAEERLRAKNEDLTVEFMLKGHYYKCLKPL